FQDFKANFLLRSTFIKTFISPRGYNRPFSTNKGQRYALTIMDRHTRWPEVIPMPNITSIT
ncbi:Uncharacterized protein FKW44_002816, partial [Caligus rogercresseyi]